MIVIRPEIVRDSDLPCCLHGEACTDSFMCELVRAMTQAIEE